MNLISYLLLGAIAIGIWFAIRTYHRAGSCPCGSKCGGNCSCCDKK